MDIAIRKESKHLIRLRNLYPRMVFSAKEASYYLNLEKGLAGERAFDEWLKTTLSKDWILLGNLLFENNHSELEIDTLLIAPHKIHLFEIKNYNGDYYIDDHSQWCGTKTNEEIKNPLHQLNRSEILLRRILKKLKVKIPIESHLVFVNPEFHLYEAPQNLPIIFPTQINRFLNKLNTNTSSLKVSSKHENLAERLLANQLKESNYQKIPKYTYEQLKKGIYCSSCFSYQISVKGQLVVCNDCYCKEGMDIAILRSIEEFKVLFPEKRLTKSITHEWCKIIPSMTTIHRILSKNFKTVQNGRTSYYV